MWAALDNGAAGAGRMADGKPASQPATGRPAERPIERLAFRSGETGRTVTLKYPFDHPVLGSVDAITIRRLTVGEVGDLITQRPADAPDLFDIYGAMCGLPAATLRGLIDVDGEEVADICWDFLPRAFRAKTDTAAG